MHNPHLPPYSFSSLLSLFSARRLSLFSVACLALCVLSLGCRRRDKRLMELEGKIEILEPSLREDKKFSGQQTLKVLFEDPNGLATARLFLNEAPVWQRSFLAGTTASTQTILLNVSSDTGQAKLSFVLTDRLGHTTKLERIVKADTKGPTIRWISPTLTGMPKEPIDIEIEASDASGIEWVRVLQGDTVLAQMETPPYAFRLDPKKLQLEPFFFVVEAKDKTGNVTQISVPIPRNLPGLGEACNEGVQCQARMYCIRVPPEKIGTCRQMCTGNEHCQQGFSCARVGVFRVCMPSAKQVKRPGPYEVCSPTNPCIDTYYCIKTGSKPPICLPACDGNPKRCPRGTTCTQVGDQAACVIDGKPIPIQRTIRPTQRVGEPCGPLLGCLEGGFCIRDGLSNQTRCRASCQRDSDCGNNQFCDTEVANPGACMPKAQQPPRAGLHEECTASLPCNDGLICVFAQGKGFCHKQCNTECTDAGYLCRTVQDDTSACFLPCQPIQTKCPGNLRCILSSIAPAQTPYICQ